MMPRMMVYGGRFYDPRPGKGGTRVIAGVRSKAEYARITGLTSGEVNKYHTETGNERELTVGLTYPGVAWIADDEFKRTRWLEYDMAKHRLTGRTVKVELTAILGFEPVA